MILFVLNATQDTPTDHMATLKEEKIISQKEHDEWMKQVAFEAGKANIIYWTSPEENTQARLLDFDPSDKRDKLSVIEGVKVDRPFEPQYVEGGKSVCIACPTQHTCSACSKKSVAFDYIVYLPEQVKQTKAFIFQIYGGGINRHYLREDYIRMLTSQNIGIVQIHLSDVELPYLATPQERELQGKYNAYQLNHLLDDVKWFREHFREILESAKTQLGAEDMQTVIDGLGNQIPVFLCGSSFGGYNVLRCATNSAYESLFNGYIAFSPAGFAQQRQAKGANQPEIDATTLSQIKQPLLLVQDIYDIRVTPNYALDTLAAFFKNAPQDAREKIHLITTSSGHNGCGARLAFESDKQISIDQWQDYQKRKTMSNEKSCQKFLAYTLFNFVTNGYKGPADPDMNRIHLESLKIGFDTHGLSDSITLPELSSNQKMMKAIERTYFDLGSLDRAIFLNFLRYHWKDIPTYIYGHSMNPGPFEKFVNRIQVYRPSGDLRIGLNWADTQFNEFKAKIMRRAIANRSALWERIKKPNVKKSLDDPSWKAFVQTDAYKKEVLIPEEARVYNEKEAMLAELISRSDTGSIPQALKELILDPEIDLSKLFAFNNKGLVEFGIFLNAHPAFDLSKLPEIDPSLQNEWQRVSGIWDLWQKDQVKLEGALEEALFKKFPELLDYFCSNAPVITINQNSKYLKNKFELITRSKNLKVLIMSETLTLPSLDLSGLDNLEVLEIGPNVNIQKLILSGDKPKLQRLVISPSNIIGGFYADLKDLSDLTYVEVLPRWHGKLDLTGATKLETFKCYTSPSIVFGTHPHLKTLDAPAMVVSDLSHMPQLEYAVVQDAPQTFGNQLKDLTITIRNDGQSLELDSMPNLQHVVIHSKSGPFADVEDGFALESLKITHAENLKDIIIDGDLQEIKNIHIENLPNLINLEVHNVIKDGLIDLKNSTHLEQLVLPICFGQLVLGEHRDLKHINTPYVKIGALTNMPNLETVSVMDVPILEELPSLKVLHIGIKESDQELILKGLLHLQELVIDCEDPFTFNPVTLKNINLTNLPGLKKLSVDISVAQGAIDLEGAVLDSLYGSFEKISLKNIALNLSMPDTNFRCWVGGKELKGKEAILDWLAR